MKTLNPRTLFLTAAIPFSISTSQAAIIAGWDSWTNGSQAATQTSGGATGTFSENSGDWRLANEAASTDGTFGTLAGASNATGTSAGIQVFTGSGALDFTITAGTNDLILESFNFDLGRKRNSSPRNWAAEIVSGPITAGSLGSGGLSTLGGPGPRDLQDFDRDLTGLADNVLEAGQTAVFRIAVSGGNGANDQRSYADNVALVGTVVPNAVIPEPSGILLSALGLTSMLLRRKR